MALDDENFRRIMAGLNDALAGRVVYVEPEQDNGISPDEITAAFHANRPPFCSIMAPIKKDK